MKSDKILVIDDDEKIQYAFHFLLEKEGCNGVEATSGSTALKLFKSDHFRAVFLDLKLPDMDGLKILESIRKIDRNVPVIIITGMGTPQNIKKSVEFGAIEFLEKPISLTKIREILREIKLTYDKA
jgi:two-component system, NtrC family, nitrogen regulation response regulator NtrX